MATLRRLGVYGKNAPIKRTLTVQPSDFLVGGIAGQFDRQYQRSYLVRSMAEFISIFGSQTRSGWYGYDAVKGFFDNAVGVDAKLYVSAYVGNDGAGSVDAVSAQRVVNDTQVVPAPAYTINFAFENEDSFGIAGNNIATKITNANRFETALAEPVLATGQSEAVLDSVSGIVAGDIVTFATVSGDVTKKITDVEESTRKVFWTGDFEVSGGSAETGLVGEPVNVLGFTLQVFQKSKSGIVNEVEAELGSIVCSSEPEVVDFYVENVFSASQYIKVEEAGAGTLAERLPADDTDAVFMIGGSDGTIVYDGAHWGATLGNFDNDPIRFLAIPETTLQAVNQVGESYCKGRDDTPLWIYNIPENRTKSQLITIGNSYQRSDDVMGIIAANWLQVTDPFATSPLAPHRTIPNVGHIMGLWVRVIGKRGVHFIPGIKQEPIYGIQGIVGDQILDDFDRTDVANAGVNVIQNLGGYGVILRNAFAPSTDPIYRFSNGLLMRNFFKVSFVDSLQGAENQPNNMPRIREHKMAMLSFFNTVWLFGSTGSSPEGESFGQYELEDGSLSTRAEHYEVVADVTNNPASSLQAGEQNYEAYFTFPSPAGSIEIATGILALG